MIFIALQSKVILQCVVQENIHAPSTEVFFGLNPPPLWKFQFTPPSPPPGISNDPLRWGSGYFLEPHNFSLSFASVLCNACLIMFDHLE